MALLLVAIVQNNDAERVVATLAEQGHRSTRIPSIGGFLGTANTTLLLGIEDDQEQAVLRIFERECSGREVEVPLVVRGRLKDVFPRVVRYGGATIFIAELRRIVHV